MKKSIGILLRLKPVKAGLVTLTAIFIILLPCITLAGENLTIVYTCSLNGYLDYCHCKANPRGGLVKRSTEITKIRNSHKNTILLDTGDFFPYEKDPLLAKYLIRAFKHIGYDALQFGDQEFNIGVKQFLTYKSILPFICNNILIQKGSRTRRKFKRYTILNKTGIKVGIIGSISPEAFRYNPKKITGNITITPQVTEIKKDVRSLEAKGIDFIVLLSHSGFETDKTLARRLPEIDVIVGGHSQTLLRKPVKIGSTIIVQAGADGAYIGILDLVLEKGSIRKYNNIFRRPDEFQPADDPYIRKLINEYNTEIRKQYKNLRFN